MSQVDGKMSIIEGLKGYYNVFGLRGVFAVAACRITSRPRELTVPDAGLGYPIYLRTRTSDLSVYREILIRGEYDAALPFSPRTIVDAGANIGMASIFFTRKYPEAKVIAIEAEASNFAALIKNVKNYSNVIPIQAALWDRDGEISVSEADPSTGAFGKWGFVTHEGCGIPVRAITMRTLKAETGIDMIDVLKVDIEGAEKEVFASCDWIQSVNCLMIELHDHLKAGCSPAVESVTGDFSRRQKGETVVYIRNR